MANQELQSVIASLREYKEQEMTRPKFILAHKPDPTRRSSPDSAWPLRGFDGLTWAERKERERARNA
jgi:hypothetical protein